MGKSTITCKKADYLEFRFNRQRSFIAKGTREVTQTIQFILDGLCSQTFWSRHPQHKRTMQQDILSYEILPLPVEHGKSGAGTYLAMLVGFLLHTSVYFYIIIGEAIKMERKNQMGYRWGFTELKCPDFTVIFLGVSASMSIFRQTLPYCKVI